MADDIKVTVMIPVYNAERYIDRCIQSVIKQTYGKWEILAIDDGSNDRSYELLQTYKRSYPEKIRIIKQENRGVAETRNRGIHEACGKYIMFLDNDDYIDCDYLEKYVNAIEKNDYDCVIGGFRRENSDGNVIQSFIPSSMWSVYAMDFVPWARIINRSFLVDNSVRFYDGSVGEDIYFNFLLLSKTDRVGLLENKGYVWFINEQSVSNVEQRGLKQIDEFILLLDKLVELRNSKTLFFDFWITRYMVWYLLYSGKTARKSDFLLTDKKLFDWADSNKIKIGYPVKRELNKDNLKLKFGVRTYLILRKLGLKRLFAAIYCK